MVVHISHLLLPSWRHGCTRPAQLRQGCLFLTQVSRFLQRQSIFRADIFCRLTDQLLRPCTKCYAISSGSVQTTGPLSLVDRKYRVHSCIFCNVVFQMPHHPDGLGCHAVRPNQLQPAFCGWPDAALSPRRYLGTHHTYHHPTAPRTF